MMYLDLDLYAISVIHFQKYIFKPAETVLNSFLDLSLRDSNLALLYYKKSNGLTTDIILSRTMRSHVQVKTAITILRCYFPMNFVTVSWLEITVPMSELA